MCGNHTIHTTTFHIISHFTTHLTALVEVAMEDPTKLYLRGLPYAIPQRDLRQWLWSWGIEVQSLVLHYNDPKKLRCSAFLHFSENARHHVPALNGSWFGQHQLECSVAKPKVARFLGWNCWVCALWETTCWEQLEREREGTHSYVRTDGPHGLQSLWLRLEKLLLWHHPRTGIVFFKECTQELGLLV